jgi:AraC family transcriptional regulator
MKHTQKSYRERISLVVAAILKEPTADHRLEDLAAIAHFSPFHFHRIYRDVTGETVAATIRRVRLAQATQLLWQGSVSVAQVSTMVGYESPQAFTRAFRAFAGRSPSEFRQRARALVGKPCVENSSANGVAQQSKIQIVHRPALSVLAMRHSGPFSTIAHATALRQCKVWITTQPRQLKAPCLPTRTCRRWR